MRLRFRALCVEVERSGYRMVSLNGLRTDYHSIYESLAQQFQKVDPEAVDVFTKTEQDDLVIFLNRDCNALVFSRQDYFDSEEWEFISKMTGIGIHRLEELAKATN